KIPLETPAGPARAGRGINTDGHVGCLMPGSRCGEVGKLGDLLLQTARRMLPERPAPQLIIPAASTERRDQRRTLPGASPGRLHGTVVLGQSHTCMAAADAILLASGTGTLEAMLMKRPMVVSYKLAPLTFWILKHMVSRKWISLPNLLADRELVPELLQQDATPEKLAAALLAQLENSVAMQQLHETFLFIHRQLKRSADDEAAAAIAGLLQQ